jgi:hypothetical protein
MTMYTFRFLDIAVYNRLKRQVVLTNSFIFNERVLEIICINCEAVELRLLTELKQAENLPKS